MTPQEFLDEFGTLAESAVGVPKLRELILDLAVRGKLVEQDEDDESAETLLGRIRAERDRKISEKTIRSGKTLPARRAGELGFDIPITWEWAQFGEFGDWGAGSTPRRGASTYYGGDTVWLKSGELNNGTVTDSEEKVTEKALKDCSLRLNQPGDVLIAMYGATIGKLAIAGVECTTNQAVCACTCFEGVYNRFLFLLLKAFKQFFIKMSSGAAQPNYSKEKIVRTSAPLPPLAEQHRIVAKVDELMGLCDRLEAAQERRRGVRVNLNRASLDRITSVSSQADVSAAWQRVCDHFEVLYDTPETLPDLRQTIIDLGSQGKLLPQDQSDAPVSELLVTNRERRRRHWGELELAKLNGKGTKPRNDNWKKKYREPTPTALDDLPALPSTWGWERIELLGDDPLAPVQTGPFGSQLLKTEFTDSGVPVVAVGNLTGTGFKIEKLYHIPPEKAAQLERYRVDAGDLLFARTGSVGRACIAPDFVDNWRMTGHILRVRLNREIVDPQLMVLFLWASSAVRTQVVENIRGMTRPGYNTSLLESIRLPIPPLSEQKRIVSKVTHLLSQVTRLESTLTRRESTRTQLLTAAIQSILNEESVDD